MTNLSQLNVSKKSDTLHVNDYFKIPPGFEFPEGLREIILNNVDASLPEDFRLPEGLEHLNLHGPYGLPDGFRFPGSLKSFYSSTLKKIPGASVFPDRLDDVTLNACDIFHPDALAAVDDHYTYTAPEGKFRLVWIHLFGQQVASEVFDPGDAIESSIKIKRPDFWVADFDDIESAQEVQKSKEDENCGYTSFLIIFDSDGFVVE